MPDNRPHISLKIRIFFSFFMILFIMILFFIGAFYRFISRAAFDKMDEEYTTMAKELNETSQNLLWKLTLTSQQLLENEDTKSILTAYKSTTDLFEKQDYYTQLVELVTLLTMSETDVSLFYFYDLDKEEIIYSNLPVDRTLSSTDCLYQNSLFQYCGPSYSQSSFIGNQVFILNRVSTLNDGSPVLFSVESGYYSLGKPMDRLEEKSAYVIFTNDKGAVLYHSLPEAELKNRQLEQILSGQDEDFHTFSQQSSQGWSVCVAVPDSAYTLQYTQSLYEFILFTFILSVVIAIFTMLFWRSIYRPLQEFDRQLGLVLTEEEAAAESSSTIPEFDYLFRKIRLLQKQIKEMLEKAILQEKENTKIQVEKLRAQINPHFLLNTLNTVHWMALMNDQKDIDEITQALSHLLSYNLDRDSYNTNLLHELNAVKEYVRLQKTRYQFSYQETILPEGSLLNYPCPKFILQPFIENSLSHGYKENMEISVAVHIREQDLEVRITDTGSGMSAENLQKIQQLMSLTLQTGASQTLASSAAEHSGRGIGLAYVISILHLYYNGQASISADSQIGSGTQFCMSLPKVKGRGYHVENTDHR